MFAFSHVINTYIFRISEATHGEENSGSLLCSHFTPKNQFLDLAGGVPLCYPYVLVKKSLIRLDNFLVRIKKIKKSTSFFLTN